MFIYVVVMSQHSHDIIMYYMFNLVYVDGLTHLVYIADLYILYIYNFVGMNLVKLGVERDTRFVCREE